MATIALVVLCLEVANFANYANHVANDGHSPDAVPVVGAKPQKW